jgi:hypothetical protein
MNSPRLHPRLLRHPAEARFTELARALYVDDRIGLADLAEEVSTSTDGALFAATGPTRMDAPALAALRESVVEAARARGFPDDPPSDSSRGDFDRALAKEFHDNAGLIPAEAAVPEVWSFHALRLLPDVLFWRWRPERRGDLPNAERFIGSDLTRHGIGRLWWRSFLIAHRAPDPVAALALLDGIGEADLDQIFTRRRAYGASPEVLRAILVIWRRAGPQAAEASKIVARELLRDLLKRVLRRGAFTDFSLLTPQDIETVVDSLLHESITALALPEGAASPEDATQEASGRSVARETRSAAHFDDVPFSHLPTQIAAIVAGDGPVREDELLAKWRAHTGADAPSKREKILRGMAWIALGAGYIARDDSTGLLSPGDTPAATDRRWGEWTMTAAQTRASELLQQEHDPLNQLTEEIFTGRRNKTVRSIARSAIKEARERMNKPSG